MSSLLTLLLYAPAILLAGGYASWMLYRSLAFGAGLLVAVYVLGAVTISPLSFQAAGFHLYVEDLLSAGLVSVALLRIVSTPQIRHRARPWYGFVAATALAFALGSSAYGVKAAGVEYRNFFYFCAGLLYCGSFPLHKRQLKTIATVWLFGSLALVALAVFRWSAELLQLGIAEQWAQVGGGGRLRVLNASQTFFLAQALLIAIYFRRRMPQWTAHVVILACAVILLQHRSVWVATLVALAAICHREGRLRKFVRVSVALVCFGGLVYLAAPRIFSRDTVVTDSLATSIEEPFEEQSTFGWRVSLWQAYLLEFVQADTTKQITGMGFGNPGSYELGTSVSADSAHNYYIFTLNRTGVLGLATLLVAYIGTLRRFRRLAGRGGWNYTGLLFGIVVSQMVYCTVYSPSPDQGLLAGATLALGSTVRRRARIELQTEAEQQYAATAAASA